MQIIFYDAETSKMRSFDYSQMPNTLLTKEIMDLLSTIHECKGRQDLHAAIKPDVLNALVSVAKIQSTEASNRIEGIRTSDKRLQQIMDDKTDLTSRDEEEIAGYRDVLNTIHESYNYIGITPNTLLQLHRDLYRHTPSSFGGHFKITDNEIRGVRSDGSDYVRFKPTSAATTPYAIEQLCESLRFSINSETMDPLLASLLFVFDFTCIHPFNDGNGRMSRLLTLLLLYRAGYDVGKYISVEKEIERTKENYYEALAKSSEGWELGENDPSPFVQYMLGVIFAAYRELENRLSMVTEETLTKSDRIQKYLSSRLGKTSKSDIAQALPDISKSTIERTLSNLLKAGKIKKVGSGRGTTYVWNQ